MRMVFFSDGHVSSSVWNDDSAADEMFLVFDLSFVRRHLDMPLYRILIEDAAASLQLSECREAKWENRKTKG